MSSASTFRQSTLLSTCLLCVWSAALVSGYPGGAPADACDTMVPAHQSNTPQLGVAPYTVKVRQRVYTAGEQIPVIVEGVDINTMFKGVFLQARVKQGGQPTQQRAGTFIPPPAPPGETKPMLKGVACGQTANSAVTHTDGTVMKNILNVTWIAPNDDAGNITFVATVVKEFNTFYVGIESPTSLQFMVKPDGGGVPGGGMGPGGMTTPTPGTSMTSTTPRNDDDDNSAADVTGSLVVVGVMSCTALFSAFSRPALL